MEQLQKQQPDLQPPASDRRPRPLSPGAKWGRRIAFAVTICFLIFAVYYCRACLLRYTAAAWIINDPVTNADAIFVLGGGLETRPFAAASLYTNHCAPAILVSQSELPPTAQMGLTVPEFVTARLVLLSNGVPASAIRLIGTNASTTREEALALREWVTQTRARSIIIPTDIFHTRRARWIFTKALRGTGAQVHVLPVDLPKYTADDWWRHEEGLIAFETEVVKWAYYRVKY
jgi:uncharacterized SAM-binding protein YcdF (DUF218 family)